MFLHSLQTDRAESPDLFHGVSAQIQDVEHPMFHASGKCSIAQIGTELKGTEWDGFPG